MKKAIITGAAGQDGSYLATELLERGREVFGIDLSYAHTEFLPEEVKRITGNIAEMQFVRDIVDEVEPDEIYNLAAHTFVGSSWQEAYAVMRVNTLGVMHFLESIYTLAPNCRMYQASTSEMFGNSETCPQREDTPLTPVSPYGVSKVAAHNMCRVYRESYGVWVSCGIGFNHECVPVGTPVIIRTNGMIDILPIDEVVPHTRNPHGRPPNLSSVQTSDGGGIEIWDGDQWVRCTARTATWHEEEIYTVHGRGGVISTTGDHEFILDGGDRPAEDLKEGDLITISQDPEGGDSVLTTKDEAWLLGMLVADGYISKTGKARVINSNEEILVRSAKCWTSVAGGSYRFSDNSSGFSDNLSKRVDFTGNNAYARYLRGEIYTDSGEKRVPKRILNATKDVQVAFFRGYYDGDGLKKGNGKDEFKSFRTTSQVLAAGLMWIARTALDRRACVYQQPGALKSKYSYMVNLSSGNNPYSFGQHLQKPLNEIRKIDKDYYEGWMFDLATESGKFAAGVGPVVIHNSPRRPEIFVTRKITSGVAKIKRALVDGKPVEPIVLGNLKSERDWSHAADIATAMRLMLEARDPDDYVIASCTYHSVEEFCDAAFDVADIPLTWVGSGIDQVGILDDGTVAVKQSEEFYRPNELHQLCGDPSKLVRRLGWDPQYTFDELVEEMVMFDLGKEGL